MKWVTEWVLANTLPKPLRNHMALSLSSLVTSPREVLEPGIPLDPKVWESLEYVASRALNWGLVGVPILRRTPYEGRNEKYLHLSMNYSRAIMASPIISFVQDFLKPVFGPLIARKGIKGCETCIDVLVPLFKGRIEKYRSSLDAPASFPSLFTLTRDLIMIQGCSNPPNAAYMDPQQLARSIEVLNFNAVPPAGISVSNR
ncbi:uncharacterized protein BDR25DRAFT_356371 [Lindgomyces ingoldianus]|uniref:Uncharacterized protein n=1 Tax=Lindgomyces ingoldianus TaxID=673940 RepID=A0ACB6QRL7_9PLEO|nr:uncharacterized protein BDR25DRAFT_356371 [Lindgomyces ingoldianus]KAF2469634.1 hypothetical protein BDR25DRAFT_356371 [Lindgomyces ingoldianus]